MSKKNAYYDILNMDAVRFSETALIVRARIVEAAETMAHTHVAGAFPPQMRSLWPEYKDQTISSHPIGYGKNEDRVRYHPDAKAISRAEEVFYKWFPNVPDKHRPMLCSWAFCDAVDMGKKTHANSARQNNTSVASR